MPKLSKTFADTANKQVGKPYVWGTAGPNTFDCSGLVFWSYEQATGKKLDPSYRDSHQQFLWGVSVPKAKAGDLLFFDTMNGGEVRLGNAASHVSIAISDTEMVHALNPTDGIKVSKIDSPWFQNQLIGIRRIFDDVSTVDDAPEVKPEVSAPKAATPAQTATLAASALTSRTPFRSVGDVKIEVWRKVFKDASSPITDIDECYYASSPHSALALCQAVKESSLGKDASAQSNKNPLGLMQADGKTLKKFAYWPLAFAEWKWRITDPSYKGKPGPYYPKEAPGFIPGVDLSMLGYIITYVGGPGCLSSNGTNCANGEKYDPNWATDGAQALQSNAPSINMYHAQTLKRLREWLSLETPPDQPSGGGTTPGDLRFGRVPAPAIVNRVIPGDVSGGAWVPSGYNSAWDNLGTRTFRGVCIHIMEGTLNGTDNYFRGDARMRALTDFGIGKGNLGEVYQWNTAASARSPWANGAADGQEGDGPAFVKKFGINAVNRDLRSIETEGFDADGYVPQRSLDLIVQLVAYLVDQAKIPYTGFPIYNGLTLVYGHFEFSQKPCPGSFIRSKLPWIIDQVGARLEHYQTGGV
jgi:NlpC/P60 family protein/N-acetylmuramoyl-L-alanine amidase-like protein